MSYGMSHYAAAYELELGTDSMVIRDGRIDQCSTDGTYLSSARERDRPSAVFPDRLIAPLPKKSLKSRLSQEAAESIEYPPTLPSSSLPTYSHYDSSVDPVALRHAGSYRSPPRSPRSARHARYGSHSGRGGTSGDGYEAFENTNNKKKRKIPTSGNHAHLTNEMAQLGINSHDERNDDVHGLVGSTGLGVQGAGRGHYARKQSTRRPLGISTNGTNMRSATAKYDQNMAATAKAEDQKDQGIISAAIANATALLRKPLSKGQENMGVLDQQAKSSPPSSQFTFTCESDAKDVQFPEQSLHHGYAQTRAHPPTPTHAGQRPVNNATQSVAPPNLNQAPPPLANADPPPRKPRRRRGDVYQLAARQRRLQQEYTNIQHPPSRADIWISEKQRLLEKAKAKGRKGKKQTKAAKAANHASQQAANRSNYDQEPLDQLADDDLDYGYDDDPEPMPAPPPAPIKQPMPGTYDTAGKGGGTSGGGDVR
ncbi:uncharacterized protein AB675_9013 [Cyphellophora attinorum]|uniref:Uncharacterized protein n=1 Tax=Cyphellophora attinorum TaxID=1664694 RepID=A0A0N1H6E8_9EURO|nr:uncharacterized protein AB675_9013 [Phialophora attinorum]KPI41584.1 hypothetical protein AB675_9013 [Phialophora attinorum]